MYRYQNHLFQGETIYIAGPECFYTNGFSMLNAMRRRAEALGFGVTLPNDNPLDMQNEILTSLLAAHDTDGVAGTNKDAVLDGPGVFVGIHVDPSRQVFPVKHHAKLGNGKPQTTIHLRYLEHYRRRDDSPTAFHRKSPLTKCRC